MPKQVDRTTSRAAIAKPIVNLDEHSIQCNSCGQRQTSPDLTRQSPLSVQACVDRFAASHRCGVKAIHRVRLDDFHQPSAEDRWKNAWAAQPKEPEPAPPLPDPKIVIDPDTPIADRWRTLWKVYEQQGGAQ